LFHVDAERARAVLNDPDLDVALSAGGKVLVGIAFYEYRHTAIGVYNEVGVAIHVRLKNGKAPTWPLLNLTRTQDKMTTGLHIIDLPVTTDAACSAGREIWGFPKFVTPISFALKGRCFRGTVTDPGNGSELLCLEGNAGFVGIRGPLLDLTLYSRHQEGQLLRTLVNTRGGAQVASGGSLRLTFNATSTHPMVARLQALGLQGAQPWGVSYSNALQVRLNAGAVVPVA
jgi:hypothetical protein